MNEYTFRELELKYGELIYIVNEKGEGVTGLYEDEYNNSNETPIARIYFVYSAEASGVIRARSEKSYSFKVINKNV